MKFCELFFKLFPVLFEIPELHWALKGKFSHCFYWRKLLLFLCFFQMKRHGQEADIHLHHHNHRCIFEANSLRPTELSWDVGYNIPSSAGKSLYCNQPNHSNTPTGVFGRDFLHFLYIYCTTYKERIYGYVKFSRYQFMVYKRLIA